MTKTPRSLSEAVDQGIARENARWLADHCRFCMGTGSYYEPIAGGHHERHECPNCNGTGLKSQPTWLRRLQAKDLTEFAPATRDLTGQVTS